MRTGPYRFALHRLVPLACFMLLAASAFGYEQSDAVRRRFPDPQVSFPTPGFENGKSGFTSQDEMMHFVTNLAKRYRTVQLRIIGRSQEGRAIPLLLLSGARIASPVDAVRLGRPVVWLQGLQHGDEPAGGEAMLAVAQALAAGELRELLDRLTVVIVPRVNPDGAAKGVHRTARGIDINRDYIKFDLPETIALRRASNEYQPQLFVDAHEYTVGKRWLEKFGGLPVPDLTLLYGTNPNIPAALAKLAEDPFRTAIERALDKEGYRHDLYFTTSDSIADKSVVMGGTAPDISRNAYSLGNALSFLLESRGVGIGREGFLRRVHSHYIAIAALLRTAALNSDRLQRTVAEARASSANERDPIVVTSRSKIENVKFPLIDPATGEDRYADVVYENALNPAPVLTRVRPNGYLIPAAYAELARKLMLNGVQVRQLLESATLDVESYEVTDKTVYTDVMEGHLRTQVRTDVQRRIVQFPSGSLFVPLMQPNGDLAALALEPESPSSFVSFGLLPVERKGAATDVPTEVPVYRLMHGAPLATVVWEGAQ
jgi:hypothetical protein